MKKWWLAVVLVLAAQAVLACQAEPAVQPAASGIEGQVWIGPTSPILGVGTPETNEPYQATIVFKDGATGEAVAEVRSDEEGRFRIDLEPGNYLVEPQSPNPGAPPYAEPQTASVQPNQFTRIEIVYESGIR
jgi:hypothetical protein